MSLVPILVIIWPLALIALTLVLTTRLLSRPEHHDDVWMQPRPSSLRPIGRG